MNEIIYPVVIVGKDRTRMTCEVVRHLHEKLLNCEPHFIIVSDRSRVGHCEAIRGFFQRELQGVDFQILETSSDRFGWGAAMNIGLEEAYKIAPYAMVLDNDWILNRPIPDLGKLCGILSSGEGDIGAITLKCPNGGRNLDYWNADYDGVSFLFSREKAKASYAYPVEIGCQLISKRFHEKMQFLECENKTDRVERDWISKFRKLAGEGFALKQVNLASEEGTALNKPGCLFYHIGKQTQSGRGKEEGVQIWSVPKEYEYLNDDERIDWKKYADRIYCVVHLPNYHERFKSLESELRRVGILDSGILEIRYTSPSIFDQRIFDSLKSKGEHCNHVKYVNQGLELQKIFYEAKFFGYERIVILEDDIRFVEDIGEMRRVLEESVSKIKSVDYLQFDYAIWGNGQYELYRQAKEAGGVFHDVPGGMFTMATFNLYSKTSYDKILDNFIKNERFAGDRIQYGLKCAISFEEFCCQNQYNSAVNLFHMTKGMYQNAMAARDFSKYSFGRKLTAHDFAVSTHYIGDKCKGRKKVSVYAIAYNESRNIDKWYSCVSEADEVVVLDTGSTDDTVEKLRKLGAYVEVEKFDKWNSVEEYDAIVARGGNPWRFDKARNDSLKLVAEDSEILVTIDIDEFMQPGWRKNLEDQWIAAEESGKHPTCAAYKYVWCYNPDGTEARTFEIHKIHARGVCHWTHMIHEVLHYDSGERPFRLKDFVVEHHQDLSKTRKSYLPMLAVEARDMPDNDRSAHYYGRELMYEGRWDESIAELKRHLSLRASGWRAERAASMRYIANCYAGKRDSEMEEFWLWKAAMEDPNHREASFRLGEIYMSRKDWRSAERAWEFCLNIKNRSQEYISDNRCWSAIPHLQYAQALWWDGNWRAACEQAEIAVQMEPSNNEAIAQRDGMQATRKQHNR